MRDIIIALVILLIATATLAGMILTPTPIIVFVVGFMLAILTIRLWVI
jgi:hypothetical protein